MRTSPMRWVVGLLVAAAPAASFTATAVAASPPDAAARGTLLKAQRIAALTRSETRGKIAGVRLPGAPAMSAARVRFGVTAYRLTYATVGVDGVPTTATGLFVLPRNDRERLRTVSYDHGTLAARADAPSRSIDSLAGASALLFAGAGFAVAEPDYLGLGYGPGAHPYLHLASEASASLDLLRAAHAFARAEHRALDDATLVTGFSQGAPAAMALGRLLQDGADPDLRLAALAPISGPFDIEHAELPAIVAGKLDPVDSNYYLSYLLHAWQPIYHVYDQPTDVWRGPWAERVNQLFDGAHDDVAIIKALPGKPALLFTPAFLARLAHPDGALPAAIQENDVACDWAPTVPLRMYAARTDEQVAYSNSRSCIATLAGHGIHTRLQDVGRTGHFGSATRATPEVVTWFERLEKR